jgi:hypothetical protein
MLMRMNCFIIGNLIPFLLRQLNPTRLNALQVMLQTGGLPLPQSRHGWKPNLFRAGQAIPRADVAGSGKFW